ncbi:MAG: glutamate synthase subunit beta [bacterium]
MGKPSGFMEYPRKTAPYRPVSKRVKDYKDVAGSLSREEIAVQAARCMDCGVPFCHGLGCPLFNLIPECNDLVYKGAWKEALMRLQITNVFPEITSRVCPAPCEAACTLAINDSPVTVRQIELAVVERGFEEGWVTPPVPQKEIKRKIAVIGSGPAGLAASWVLKKYGFSVTVFEKSAKAGGILRYGIPDFKLEKWVLERRIELMKKAGIKFETGVNVGEDVKASYLRRSFDAVLLAPGAGYPRDIDIPGRGLKGIYFAMDYLTGSNRCVSGEVQGKDIISAKNRTVLVIGGGDTGSDCIGTASRQGAKKICQIEILPAPPPWDKDSNPSWPDWPQILRTSSSQEEGAERQWSVMTKSFSGKDNKVTNAECVRVEWEKTSGGVIPREIPGSGFTIKADIVFLAMGFLHAEHSRLLKDLKIEFDGK